MMEIDNLKNLVHNPTFVELAKQYKTGYYARNEYQQNVNAQVIAQAKTLATSLGLEIDDSVIEELVSRIADIEYEDLRSKTLLERGMKSTVVDYAGDFERSMQRRANMQTSLAARIEELVNTKTK